VRREEVVDRARRGPAAVLDSQDDRLAERDTECVRCRLDLVHNTLDDPSIHVVNVGLAGLVPLADASLRRSVPLKTPVWSSKPRTRVSAPPVGGCARSDLRFIDPRLTL